MTKYDKHPFIVGQQVARPEQKVSSCEVMALIGGRDGPEYRVRSLDSGFEAVVAERELAYALGSTSTVPVSGP